MDKEMQQELLENLKKIKAFSLQPNALLDKQRITAANSLMYPVYMHALHALENIMDSSRRWVVESNKSRKKDFYGYGNNVIAFCAPRGQGKTSVMLSLSHALEHCDDVIIGEYSYPHDSDRNKCKRNEATRCFAKEQSPLWEKTIEDKHFLVMPPIDPTVLDGEESVVNLVLAWLFQEINEAWKNCQGSPEYIEKEKQVLLKHFQKCKECLARHKGTKNTDLSDLIKKSIIFEIKEHLYEIINCYFRICGITKPDIENYLIIQLDDTDMDMVNAYDVLEDVRKFLSLPQTIVLMATYLRQLRMLVAKHYEDVFALPQGNKAVEHQPIDYMQMAAKYIDKLIPAQQMIHIGSFRHQRDLNGKVSIRSFLEDLSYETASTETEPGNNKSDDLEEAFFALIQDKTGMIFKKHSTYVNNMLPPTLRGLVHLFQLLDRMESPKSADSFKASSKNDFVKYYHNLQIQQRNLLLFEDYFRNDWCYSNLVEDDQEIMWKISQAHVAPKLRIIRNLLLERWKWADSWLRKRISSDLELDVKNRTLSLSVNPTRLKNNIPDALIRKLFGSAISLEPKDFKNASLHCEFDERRKGSLESQISFFDITCLLDEAEHRAESMNDLLLIFAIRTHLSILLQKLYLSDELESIAEACGNQEASEAKREKGIVAFFSHPHLSSFLCCEPSQKFREASLKDITVYFETKDNIKQLDSCDRIALLYFLLFEEKPFARYSEEETKEDPKQDWNKYYCPDKAYNKLLFALQEAAFRILGNHEVLRLWLSNDPARFAKCISYIYDDDSRHTQTRLENSFDIILEDQDSVKTILDAIRKWKDYQTTDNSSHLFPGETATEAQKAFVREHSEDSTS